MKLTKEQKSELSVLVEMANAIDINILRFPEDGSTIGWYRNFKNSNMVTVAVSYLLPEEGKRYRRKTGIYFVLKRLFDIDGKGEKIQLPLGKFTDSEIQQILVDKFAICNLV